MPIPHQLARLITMTYAPPPPGFGYQNEMIQPKKTSGIAIAALVVSLIFCIPFVTSLIGLILGLVGLGTASRPGKKGVPIAAAAVILSVLGLAGWSYISYWGWQTIGAPARDAIAFMERLQVGDFSGAAKYTAPPFDPNELPGVVDRMKKLGAFKQMTDFKPTPSTNAAGETVLDMKLRMVFANGIQDAQIEIVRRNEGWRVTRLNLIDPAGLVTPNPTTAPATLPATGG